MSVLGGSHLPAVSPESSILWVLPLGGLWPCQAEVGELGLAELVVVVCLGADPVPLLFAVHFFPAAPWPAEQCGSQ